MKNTTGEHEAAANGSAVDVRVGWPPSVELNIVGPKDENYMDTAHAEEQRDNGQGHRSVFDEQAF